MFTVFTYWFYGKKKIKTKKKSNQNDSDKKITHDNIKEWVKKKTVAKNMRKVDLVIYLESIGVKVTSAMKAKKDNLVQEVYDNFAWKIKLSRFLIWIEIQCIKYLKICCVSVNVLSGNGLNFLRGRGSSKNGNF